MSKKENIARFLLQSLEPIDVPMYAHFNPDDAAERILKEIEKIRCKNCKLGDGNWCDYHKFNIPDNLILKCNDFIESEAK